MESKQIDELLEKQRRFYQSGATIPVDFRIQQLKKLYAAVKNMKMIFRRRFSQILVKAALRDSCVRSGLRSPRSAI